MDTPWVIFRGKRFSYKLDRRAIPVFLILCGVGFAVLVVSISYGEYQITAWEVLQTLIGVETGNSRHELVVWTFRMPRILVAFMVGMALAVSGTILQGLTRNPLADPGILGVTAGASLAAVVTIVVVDVGAVWLPFVAFGGGMTMAVLIFTLAWKNGTAPIRLILVGVGLSAMAAALINLLMVFGDINLVQQATLWLAGSVHARDWGHVWAILPWLAVLLPLAVLMARPLNALGMGDDLATGLGVRVEMLRILLLVISVALAAAAVAVAGAVGFVGLVAPHIARRLVGPSHEGLLPVGALLGGVLLISADLLGRWVIAPSELPVGIVAALLGAPYFAYLLYQTRNQ